MKQKSHNTLESPVNSVVNSVIPAEVLDEKIRAVWSRKCGQEASEKKISAADANVRVDVFLFMPLKSDPLIYVETRRSCDLFSDHIITRFTCIPIAIKTFNDYVDFKKATLHTNTLNKKGFTVTFN